MMIRLRKTVTIYVVVVVITIIITIWTGCLGIIIRRAKRIEQLAPRFLYNRRLFLLTLKVLAAYRKLTFLLYFVNRRFNSTTIFPRYSYQTIYSPRGVLIRVRRIFYY